MNMVLFPIPESALADNIEAWLATRTESFLTGAQVYATWPTELPDALAIVIEPGPAQDQQIVDTGMLNISVIGKVGDRPGTMRAAQYLKAALRDLTGNEIARLDRILGPTPAADVSSRPKRLLSVNYVTRGSLIA